MLLVLIKFILTKCKKLINLNMCVVKFLLIDLFKLIIMVNIVTENEIYRSYTAEN